MIGCKRLLTWMTCLLLVQGALAQQEFRKEFFIRGNDTLPYRLLYPAHYKASKHYPLVLFLHGGGVCGNDNTAQLRYLPAMLLDSAKREQYPCFVLVPQCPANDTWVNFSGFPNSLHATDTPTRAARMVLQLLHELEKDLRLDSRRLYVTGLSMGGEGSFDLLQREPGLFAAAVPVCPVADTATAARIARVPVWVFHGALDKINEVKYSRIMIAALQAAGGKPRYTEYPDAKHNCWVRAYQDAALLPWLFAQRAPKKNKRNQ